MFSNNTKFYGSDGSKKRKKMRSEKSFNELAMMQILKCFASEDFNTLENYLNTCNRTDLESLFKEKGYQIFNATTLQNASAINFIVERIPANLVKTALRAENYKAVRMHLYGETRLEKLGLTDDTHKQLRQEFFKAYLKIDKEGVTDLLYGPHPSEEIANLVPSIKEDFKLILESMTSRPKFTA